MADIEESVTLFRKGFEDLAAEGEVWVELPEVARRAMAYHEDYMRRRQAVNRVLSVFGINRPDMPKKAPYKYRAIESSLVVGILEEQGELEHMFLNGEGELFTPPSPDPHSKAPRPKLDFRDRRYHYLPAAVQLEPVAAHSNGQPARRMLGPAEPYVM